MSSLKQQRRLEEWRESQKNPTCDYVKGGKVCGQPAVVRYPTIPFHSPFYRCADVIHQDDCRAEGLRDTCLVCDAQLDVDGKCRRPNHEDFQSDYGWPEDAYNGIFHTRDEAEYAPPVSFLIKDFLQLEGVTAIAAPVRERKSLIALNVAHALVTGEKLFGHFEVVKQPKRVVYLCPEVSLGPFTDRVKKIGLLDYVGWKFLYRTLSADGHVSLTDPNLLLAVPESVVFLDTAIRFLEGDENSSKDVRAFADTIFSLLKLGAEAVVILHHSPKDAGDTMTLENAMRGSGDMGAFLASCWGTRLQDPQDPYRSRSFLSNLKQRDFSSEDFEVTCGEDCRMHIVNRPDDPMAMPPALKSRKNRGNKDGMDTIATELIKANPRWSEREAVRELKAQGITRSRDWVREQRYRMGSGVVVETG